MSFRSLPLSALIVNRANDRHGELENETAAIAWLFNNREQHMKNLAKDIAAQRGVYDPPLVTDEDGKYIVFDGNRRVTCLKLLIDPARAPSIDLQNYFKELRDDVEIQIPESIICQIENDRDRVDEILYRRHTGAQGGIGQSTWDDRMKANFVSRTGKGTGVHVADEIEKQLVDAKLWDSNRKIPRSNMNRLFSSEAYRNRLGFSIAKGHLEYTREKSVVIKALNRVADDMVRKNIVLSDIWDVGGKRGYLDKLDREGVLPTAAHILTKSEPDLNSVKPIKTKPSSPKPSPAPKPDPRTTLIPNYLHYAVTWSGEQQRLKSVWEELQFHLNLADHPNAIAVMFRLLVELSIDNYIEKSHIISVHENDSLAKRAAKVAEDLFLRNTIDKKYYDECKKLQNGDQLFSMATMNRWVHSPKFNPSTQHMTSMWDTLSAFVVLCINA